MAHIGIMEKKMETSTVYWGSIGIMEKKMETLSFFGAGRLSRIAYTFSYCQHQLQILTSKLHNSVATSSLHGDSLGTPFYLVIVWLSAFPARALFVKFLCKFLPRPAATLSPKSCWIQSWNPIPCELLSPKPCTSRATCIKKACCIGLALRNSCMGTYQQEA